MDPSMQVDMVDLTCRSSLYDGQLVEALRLRGVKVNLWLSGCLPEQRIGTQGVDAVLSFAGALPLRSRRLRSAAKSVEYSVNATRLIEACRPGRVVHLQWLPMLERWPRFDLFLLDTLRRRGARLVHTVHNVLPHDSGDGLRTAFTQAYAMSDALICHTVRSRDRLTGEFGVASSAVHVIPHGPLPLRIPGAASGAEVRAAHGLGPHERFVLMFGFMRPYKGVEDLIEAWRRIRETHPSFRLVLAGSGPEAYTRELRRQIRSAGLEGDIVTSFRFLPEEELGVLVREAELLVFPYREVTQSGALLAGMAAGAAVVATRVGGFIEAVEHACSGWLVAPGSPFELYSAIRELLDAPGLRSALGRRARERAENEYGWSRIADDTIACYESVLTLPGLIDAVQRKERERG